MHRLAAALVFSLCVAGCARPASPPRPVAEATVAARPSELETSTLEAEGMSRAPFVQLTRWLRDTPVPVFSLLVTRHGKLD
jgi:hypothetical protein